MRVVNVEPETETPVSFDVSCLGTGLEVRAPFTGLDVDSEVTAVVDGKPSPFNTWSSARVTRLSPGRYEVTLEGLAPNCRLDSPVKTRQVEVRLREVTPVDFPITCVSTHAVVLVTATTTGLDSDLDGYWVRVNQDVSHLSANLDFWSVLTPGGDGTVEIVDVSDHCVLIGEPVRTIHTTIGSTEVRDTARVSFEVTCGTRWAFAMVRNSSITLASADGQETHALEEGTGPAWSPDGRSLAYQCADRVCVKRMDGAHTTAPDLTSEYESSPAWLPDGRLSYLAYACDWYCYYYIIQGIRITSPSGLSTLWSIPESVTWMSEITWSPDGGSVAFTCDHGNRRDICRSLASGHNEFLTSSTPTSASWGPSWSPDGRRLVFATTKFSEVPELAILELGGALQRVKPGLGGEDPFWLPDGQRIIFSGAGQTERGLYLINIDGTGLVRLTSEQDYSSAWRPAAGGPLNPGIPGR
jgi:Tol biopolymer transport system component